MSAQPRWRWGGSGELAPGRVQDGPLLGVLGVPPVISCRSLGSLRRGSAGTSTLHPPLMFLVGGEGDGEAPGLGSSGQPRCFSAACELPGSACPLPGMLPTAVVTQASTSPGTFWAQAGRSAPVVRTAGAAASSAGVGQALCTP